MGNKGEIIIYQTEENETQIEVRPEEESVWLTQTQMVKLFDTTMQNISLHINNYFKEEELQRNSVVKEYLTTAIDGKDYNTKYFNLDVIISVGYRVKSRRGTQFRIWANKILIDYLLKGFAINKKLLQNRNEKLNQLNETIKLISSISVSEYLSFENKDTFLLLLERYSNALNILDDYDYIRFKEIPNTEISFMFF
ncbi:MAG: virulence RhuM family protein [Bacteroidetes bacterium]|nr:virulence RhuM family protein [Bacteroidota bacterium]